MTFAHRVVVEYEDYSDSNSAHYWIGGPISHGLVGSTIRVTEHVVTPIVPEPAVGQMWRAKTTYPVGAACKILAIDGDYVWLKIAIANGSYARFNDRLSSLKSCYEFVR